MFRQMAARMLGRNRSSAPAQSAPAARLAGALLLSAFVATGCAAGKNMANPFDDFIHITVTDVPKSEPMNKLLNAAWPRVTVRVKESKDGNVSVDAKAGLTRGLVSNPDGQPVIWVPAARDRYGRYHPGHWEYVP